MIFLVVDAIIEGASLGGVGLVFVLDGVGDGGLDVHAFFRDMWQGRCLHKLPSRVSQGESLHKIVRVRVLLRIEPFAPWLVRTSWPERQPL